MWEVLTMNGISQEKLNEIDQTIKQKLNLSRQSSSSINDSNYEKENEKRKCNTEFLLIKEKAIISFNLKKYEESFQYLKNSGVIKNEEEYSSTLKYLMEDSKNVLMKINLDHFYLLLVVLTNLFWENF